MPRKTMTYEEKKLRYKTQLLDYLIDYDQNLPDAKSISITEVRAHLHHMSASSYMLPILKEMESEGLVTLQLRGNDGVVYFTDAWRKLHPVVK